MVCNLVDLDTFMRKEVLARYDHENLNTLQEFAAEVPTTENLCIRIYEIVQRGFTHAHLERIRLEETLTELIRIRRRIAFDFQLLNYKIVLHG